ncbi:MAG: hypothetical protein U0575_14870 [Phycisphaerales bacterium]
MASPLRTSPARLHARRCVRCGYDGALLKGGRAPRCARCGCDLRARPARSYAEMEGLVPAPTTQRPAHRADEQRIIERWLAGAVVAIVVVIATAALLARLSGA